MKKLTKDSKFPERLRSLIKDRLNITQAAFCKKHGITTGYLSMILSGKRGPSADLISEIYINYSKHLTWLLTGKDEFPRQDLVANESDTQRVIVEHQDIIKGFHDPVLGKELNEELILVQNTDPTLFKSTVQSVKAAGNMARAMRDAQGVKGISPTADHLKEKKQGDGKEQWEGGETRKDGTNGK